MVEYTESKGLFEVIKTDAQFCKWVLDCFGSGVYLVLAWRKGRKGFWNFMKVEIQENKYRRLKRNLTREQIELKKEKVNQRQILDRMKSNIGRKKQELQEESEISEDIIADIKLDIKDSGKHGCYPYLKSVQPVYSWHSLDDYGIKKEEDVFVSKMI